MSFNCTSSLASSCQFFEQLVLPDIEFLSKKEVVVQVSDCPVHRITVSHLHHCCSRLAFHELNLNEEKYPADHHISKWVCQETAKETTLKCNQYESCLKAKVVLSTGLFILLMI